MRSTNDNGSGWLLKRSCLTFTLILVLTSVIALALARPTTPTVCACTPPPGGLPHYTVADRTNAAEIVLEGTVIALTDPDASWYTATVEVHWYFKERGPAIVTISNLGWSSLCLSPVHVGERWVFYTTGNPSTGLSAHYLSQFDAVDPADPQIIAEVIAAVGHDPVLPYRYYAYLPLILRRPLTALRAPMSNREWLIVVWVHAGRLARDRAWLMPMLLLSFD